MTVSKSTGGVANTFCNESTAGRKTVKVFIVCNMTTRRSYLDWGITQLKFGIEALCSVLRLVLSWTSLKIWLLTGDFQVLIGHTGSVLCLQYDDKVIISGSSDSTVRVWNVHTGEMVHSLIHHCEAVLHLRFNNGMMVTCSKVRGIVCGFVLVNCQLVSSLFISSFSFNCIKYA